MTVPNSFQFYHCGSKPPINRLSVCFETQCDVDQVIAALKIIRSIIPPDKPSLPAIPEIWKRVLAEQENGK